MRKENCMRLLFAGVSALFFIGHSTASAADTVVVIPLFTTATCAEPDEVRSASHCWKDRNLGASRVATSSNDNAAFGDRYQWGRPRDGHQNLYSTTTTDLSGNDVPGHNDFIKVPATPYDWRNPRNNNLWQGLGGVNNPCPQGFRLPTYTELENERRSWVSNNVEGAFLSPLKLVAAGSRLPTNGSYSQVGDAGRYWSSTVSGSNSRFLSILIDSNGTTMASTGRANGHSVRCLKD